MRAVSLLRRPLFVGEFDRARGNGVTVIERLPFGTRRAGTELGLAGRGGSIPAAAQQKQRQQQRQKQPMATDEHESLRLGTATADPGHNLGGKRVGHKPSISPPGDCINRN